MIVPALEYHRLTSYGWPDRFGLRDDPRMVQGFLPMVPHRKPPAFKTYPGLPTEPAPTALDELLFLAAGVVRFKDLPGGDRMYFRAAGSAGNLSPLEVYVVFDGRVLHYEPVEHSVTPLGPAPAGPTTVVVTGVPWRTAWKYAERGFRHLYWDAGTMISQLLAAAGGVARLRLGFVDADVARLVGADGVHEFPLAVVVLGEGEPPLLAAGEHTVPAGFLADRPREFPLITAAQRAGDLHDEAEVDAWAAAPASPPAAVDLGFGRPLGEVVRRRGSTRGFKAAAAPAVLLVDAMKAATSPLNGDFSAPGRSLLDHHLLVHAVEGLSAGAYRWCYDTRALRLEAHEVGGDTRAVARTLTLNQRLGGDGAYTAFHCADLEEVTSALGDRGYRCAQLEAGVVEGRLHLGAFALGFGATGLTFFDDEVRRVFAIDSWPMLVTAVGEPVYRARLGGDPGQPTRLG